MKISNTLMQTMQRVFGVALVLCVVLAFAVADYRSDALRLHNKYRAKHHAPALSLCDRVSVGFKADDN